MKKNKIIILIVFFLVLLTSFMSKHSYDENSYHITGLKCIGCEACVEACPVDAISMVGGKAIIDEDKCIQCDICVGGDFADYTGCPVNAINRPTEEEDDE